MKWVTLNIIGLLCALAVFGTSATFAASSVPAVVQSELPSGDDDDFLNNNDLSIGDLLDQDLSSASQEAHPPTIKVEASGEATVKVAVSSAPPVKKETPVKDTSSQPAESKETASSQPVKAPVTSIEETSSVDKPYSEIITSEVPSSSSFVSEVFTSQVPSSSSFVSEVFTSQVPSSSPPAAESSVPSVPAAGSSVDEAFLNILSGAVQREMIGANSPPIAGYYEAYKAQAVASHSYMEYYKQTNGSYPNMPYTTPNEKVTELVRSVINQVMYYNGAVINASYHAAAGGQTQSASYVWASDIPYLKAVTSPYDDYVSSYTISAQELSDKLAAAGITVSGDPSTWFNLDGATFSDGGFVDYIPVGGTTIKGRTLRENVLGLSNLKSCKITSIAADANYVTFNTKGYGHGAGMSQQGAMGYSANEGYSYSRILMQYYTGVEIRG